MDIRDVYLQGLEQVSQWYEDGLRDLTAEQVNSQPDGRSTSIGFNAWHWYRTIDNVANFVLRRQKPIWLTQGFAEWTGLPPVAQGTGMDIEEEARAFVFDPDVLREYGALVTRDVIDYVRTGDLGDLDEVLTIKPLGDLPRWHIINQVLITHGFMHLGEINAARGRLGLSFSM